MDFDCTLGLPGFTNLSKLLVEQIEEVVLELVENASPGPRLELELDAVLEVALENQLELARERSIEEADRDLVVDLEGAVVEVGGADRAPHAVDGHDLLMQQGLGVFEDAHAAGEELVEIAVRRVLHHRHVGGIR